MSRNVRPGRKLTTKGLTRGFLARHHMDIVWIWSISNLAQISMNPQFSKKECSVQRKMVKLVLCLCLIVNVTIVAVGAQPVRYGTPRMVDGVWRCTTINANGVPTPPYWPPGRGPWTHQHPGCHKPLWSLSMKPMMLRMLWNYINIIHVASN